MTVSGLILVAHLFPEMSQHLVDLLRSLACNDWHRPTISSRRNVKDIVCHLLDGSLRRLVFDGNKTLGINVLQMVSVMA